MEDKVSLLRAETRLKALHPGRAFLVPQVHKKLFKKERDSLVELGVLERYISTDWVATSFAQPKKNQNELRFLSGFFSSINACSENHAPSGIHRLIPVYLHWTSKWAIIPPD